MNNVSQYLNRNMCTGCKACAGACFGGGYLSWLDIDGFLSVCVDNEKCNNCGLCVKACPVLNPQYLNNKNPESYAFMASDEIRKGSSSGGAFPVLAHHFVNNAGYVCGAVWGENCTVKHIVSNKIEDIELMRSSKYLQSDIGDCYKKIKNLLKENKKVLFTGTPCQVAGLKGFLRKDYENLYCVDIICHGTPSPKVFKKYIEEIKNNDEKFVKTNFRDKCNGWIPYLTTTITSKNNYSFGMQEDLFLQAFLSNLSLKESCGDCKFNKIPRQGDITIGDFWKIGNYNPKYDDKNGTSVILVNNSKGTELLEILKLHSKMLEKTPLEVAIKGNKNLIQSSKHHPNRNLFFELLDKVSLRENLEICLKDKMDYLLVNFWDSYYNYGALLTAYAMQEMVKDFGYIPKLLDTEERSQAKWFKNSWMERFAQKYLNLVKSADYKKCEKLTQNIKGVILGSDQVLRIAYCKRQMKKYLLSFAGNCRKIALSASFGINYNEFLDEKLMTKKHFEFMKHNLRSFDYLSCREISGKEIYKNAFGLESDMIIDPVFLIDKNKYEKVIHDSKDNSTGGVFLYILDKDERILSFCNKFAQNHNMSIKNLKEDMCEVSDWLKNIRDCSLLITDSFHGCCFALIFNKPFICKRNLERGNTRFDSLSEIFNLENNYIDSYDELTNKTLPSMDYNKINAILNTEKERCLRIVSKILNENYSNNPDSEENKKLNERYLKNLVIVPKFSVAVKFVRYYLLSKIMFGKRRKSYKQKRNKILNELRFSI